MKRRLKLALSAFTKRPLAACSAPHIEVRPRASTPRPLYIATGRSYRARNGARIGPLRPFRDEEDGHHKDEVGRSAWFYADGIGAYDRFGHFLSGQAGESPLDCVAEWKPAQIIGFDQFSIVAPFLSH
ncbi:hypothetical protein [Mesorhizobium argentiipisi]|uniref:Uncharacterized protein n=1 Tax=Mesorhizobium argentiipisi TaxID=3015175 RepID=A0ABU8KBF5_9HYPH